jgi:hypothetical protein
MSQTAAMLGKAARLFLTLVMLATLITAWTANQANANHQPANKAAASASKIERLEADLPPEVGAAILTSTFKTSAPTDLMMNVTLECAIVTELLAQGGPEVTTAMGEAEGRIRVWLTFDGEVVPINTMSDNPQPQDSTAPGNDSDYVTFCNNHQRFSVTDAEDGMDGTDSFATYLKTKTANAFNWVYLNTGSGLHTVEVRAAYDEPTVATPGSTATGMVGNRMLIIEPTKFSNHASV